MLLEMEYSREKYFPEIFLEGGTVWIPNCELYTYFPLTMYIVINNLFYSTHLSTLNTPSE